MIGLPGLEAEPGSYVLRRLMPLECERLQGFPDGWTEYGYHGERISDTKRYQMLGNSVAVPCVAYIMQGMKEAFGYSEVDRNGKKKEDGGQ